MICVEKSDLNGILSSSKNVKPSVWEPDVDDVNVIFAALKTLSLGHDVCNFSTDIEADFVNDSTFDMSNSSRFGQQSYQILNRNNQKTGGKWYAIERKYHNR